MVLRFVIESSKSLKEDQAEISARRLDQIAGILFVVANISNPLQPNPANSIAPITPKPFSPRPVDVCINAFWFFSLILSAAVALISMLAKEWCYRFMSGRTGDPWSQVKRRQQRWVGVEKWKMEQAIMVLPSFIHLAFLSFATGLCVYLWDLHMSVAVPATIVTLGSMLVYAASTTFPLFNYFVAVCPYSTSVSRLIKMLQGSPKNFEEHDSEEPRIAVEALSWLISTSEDPKSTDIALQAIAGAYSSDEDKKLLEKSGADKMISRCLIALNPDSNSYEQILDLCIRARSFFRPSLTEEENMKAYSNQMFQKGLGLGNQRFISRELQGKIRDLRNTINKQIIIHMTPSNLDFLPTPGNMRALNIGSTAASHCLRSLQHGIKAQTGELFDSVIRLLEGYKNGQDNLGPTEIQYLMTCTAMWLSSLLVDCHDHPAIGAHHIMQLLRIATRAEGKQQLRLGYLRLPLVVYALSRRDYPGWIRPPPLSPISRAERAIEVIAYYVSHPHELEGVSADMINLALLQLLSDSENVLHDDGIVTISETFDPMSNSGAGAHIHTLALDTSAYVASYGLEAMDKLISEHEGLLSEVHVAIACLTMLNRTITYRTNYNVPPVKIYAFVIACILSSDMAPSDPEAYAHNSALDVMHKFHGHLEADLDLAQSLGENEILAKLKQAAALGATSSDANFNVNLFAIGQACYLIGLAIESGAASHEDWKRCLMPFVQDESLWESPDTAISRLEEQRNTLAKRYRAMWNNDPICRHPYFNVLYNLLPAEIASPSPTMSRI
ncbi:transmembrane protein, putative [Rhizoctonia solani AG-3 Rhs1AP]|uniref:Transmembrane protein, putative n=2 Tax=Rhizoctonia solani AG-3 TaxID=1086053 RepID=A0A0A1UJV6_9AGAM|nr:transmembrane protein, putative [Rhizoctonia solani AG-3 Rhs1AP]KEP53905.1 putative transmembrane protein [Rhizoctonia solani 123E]